MKSAAVHAPKSKNQKPKIVSTIRPRTPHICGAVWCCQEATHRGLCEYHDDRAWHGKVRLKSRHQFTFDGDVVALPPEGRRSASYKNQPQIPAQG